MLEVSLMAFWAPVKKLWIDLYPTVENTSNNLPQSNALKSEILSKKLLAVSINPL